MWKQKNLSMAHGHLLLSCFVASYHDISRCAHNKKILLLWMNATNAMMTMTTNGLLKLTHSQSCFPSSLPLVLFAGEWFTHNLNSYRRLVWYTSGSKKSVSCPIFLAFSAFLFLVFCVYSSLQFSHSVCLGRKKGMTSIHTLKHT